MEIRPLTQEERKYAFLENTALEEKTGNIGVLCGAFVNKEEILHTKWRDCQKQWKSEDFKAELEEVIDGLRWEQSGLLTGRKEMKEFVKQFPDAAFLEEGEMWYGFRIDTKRHAYFLRCAPFRDHGFYDFVCYCYVSRTLELHMRYARQGITFVDARFQKRFNLPDGGRLIVTAPWGDKTEVECRYIDKYHVVVGFSAVHVYEYAKGMEKDGYTFEPKQEEPEKMDKKKDQERQEERMEKRINAGYEIIQTIQVGDAEFVLGVHETEPDHFVTWKSSPDRPDYCYWGHYTNTLLKATRDLCERALDEVQRLEQREKERQEYEKKQEPKRETAGKAGKGKNRDMER